MHRYFSLMLILSSLTHFENITSQMFHHPVVNMGSKKGIVLDATMHLISDLRHEDLTSLEDIAVSTVELVENIINDDCWKTAEQLLSLLKEQMRAIYEILPQHTIPINILRHMLKAVRDEYDSGMKHKGEEQSLHNMITANKDETSGRYSANLDNLRELLHDHLVEYKVEIESSLDNIAAQALEHIHANEIILTLGNSAVVLKFLKTAAKSRSFQVICVEGEPDCDGIELAQSLGKANIKTTVISDAAVLAIMSRVNKVVVGTDAVMADGTLCAKTGMYTIGRCAKHYSVPVIVLTHLYQLSSKHTFPYNPDPFGMTINPEKVLPLSMGPILSEVTVYNPPIDKMKAEFVTLYVTHQGGNAPSYLYRLLTDLYHPDDHNL